MKLLIAAVLFATSFNAMAMCYEINGITRCDPPPYIPLEPGKLIR